MGETGEARASWRVVEERGGPDGAATEGPETSGAGVEKAAVNAVMVTVAWAGSAQEVHMSRSACIASADDTSSRSGREIQIRVNLISNYKAAMRHTLILTMPMEEDVNKDRWRPASTCQVACA